jgi:F0F1-type ATP synthase assembly protein I
LLKIIIIKKKIKKKLKKKKEKEKEEAHKGAQNAMRMSQVVSTEKSPTTLH